MKQRVGYKKQDSTMLHAHLEFPSSLFELPVGATAETPALVPAASVDVSVPVGGVTQSGSPYGAIVLY